MEKEMNGSDRRKKIVKMLLETKEPLSGTALGKGTGVSRQVVVQDIALLRTEGYQIVSTVRGYYIENSEQKVMLVKVHHTNDQIAEELNTIVDMGGVAIDVIVNHRIYGKICANLNIATRKDIKNFLEDMKAGRSEPLLNVTGGYHFHHIGAQSNELLEEIRNALEEKGFLAEILPYEKEEED